MGAFGYISASVEGWALYAERLAAEQGWYDGDIEGQLGQLSDELWRARRLVSEVERYVVWPGQACSYMVGQLKILELREKVLGAKFSLREYHNAVLAAGSVPLSVLERQVDAYIARAQA